MALRFFYVGEQDFRATPYPHMVVFVDRKIRFSMSADSLQLVCAQCRKFPQGYAKRAPTSQPELHCL